jgi:hypothetical protein
VLRLMQFYMGTHHGDRYSEMVQSDQGLRVYPARRGGKDVLSMSRLSRRPVTPAWLRVSRCRSTSSRTGARRARKTSGLVSSVIRKLLTIMVVAACDRPEGVIPTRKIAKTDLVIARFH